MLTTEEVAKLEALDGRSEAILSVYLDLDPERRPLRTYRTVFEDLIKEERDRLADKKAVARLEEEAARVQEWLETTTIRGRGVAIFSCIPEGIWRIHVLQVHVDDHVAFDSSADVAPLIEILDEHERYAVAVVDKRVARIFSIFCGEIEEIEAFKDVTVGTHDKGGISQANFRRHYETHVYRHLQRVAEGLADLHRRRSFHRLILAGPVEPISELRRVLPRALASTVVGSFAADTSAPPTQILEQSLKIEEQVQRDVELRLLGQIIDLARTTGHAACGVQPTLEALWADNVQALIVADGAHAEGSECTVCGHLEERKTTACTVCGSPARPVHDIFHRAMTQADERHARVEVVHDDGARRLIDAGGGMGALLRYQPAKPGPQSSAAAAASTAS